MEEQDLSFMIKKVEFQIDESFPDPLIAIDSHPFEIHNAGYGEFPITLTIYFQDPNERPLEYTHWLMFDKESNSENRQNKKNMAAPIISEKNNEITFYEPTEHFYEILKHNQYERYKERQRHKYQNYSAQEISELTARQEVVPDISKYQNYLSHYNHKPLVRAQFKEHFAQRDKLLQNEQADLEALEYALMFLKEQNLKKANELEQEEAQIKRKQDDKQNLNEQYKA